MDKISIAKVCQHMEIVNKQHHIISTEDVCKWGTS